MLGPQSAASASSRLLAETEVTRLRNFLPVDCPRCAGTFQARDCFIFRAEALPEIGHDPMAASRRRRALIVEDEFLIAHDIETTMHALGFDDCDLAPNGRRAHSLSMSDQPDIVVVDVCLEGGREGIEVGPWLREMFDVPVVFVTSYSDDDTV